MTDNTEAVVEDTVEDNRPVFKQFNIGEIIEIEDFFGKELEELGKMKTTIAMVYIILKRRGEKTTFQKCLTLDNDVIAEILNSVQMEAPKAPNA